MSAFPPVRGIVFDMDGTLVESALDFDAMRREMNLPHGQPVLEALAAMAEDEARWCRAILEHHERLGAERAFVIPGVTEFLTWLHERGIKQAVWTRNGREAAWATLARLDLRFERIITREDGPAKPDPSAIWAICEAWNLDRREVILIGDYVFDLEAAKRAGIRGVLFTAGAEPHQCAGHELADFALRSFTETAALRRFMGHDS